MNKREDIWYRLAGAWGIILMIPGLALTLFGHLLLGGLTCGLAFGLWQVGDQYYQHVQDRDSYDENCPKSECVLVGGKQDEYRYY